MTQSAAHRCLDILELLADHADGASLGDICEQLALPKSVGHRLLALLSDRGFVRQSATSGRYALTLKLTLLGMRYYSGTGINDVAQPILERLAANSGELARLAVVEGEGMLWVAKAQGARHGLRYDPDSGTTVVLHATAVGKIWLSSLPEADAVRIVAATKFAAPARFGPSVMRSIEQLKRALAETRARGYGVAVEEGEPGTAAVAAAVRANADPLSAVVGTLSLAGPVGRMSEHQRALHARELISAAAELSALWPLRGSLNAAAPASASSTPFQGSLAHVD